MLNSRQSVSFIYQIIHELPEAVKSLKALSSLQTMGNVQHSPLTLQGHLFFFLLHWEINWVTLGYVSVQRVTWLQ